MYQIRHQDTTNKYELKSFMLNTFDRICGNLLMLSHCVHFDLSLKKQLGALCGDGKKLICNLEVANTVRDLSPASLRWVIMEILERFLNQAKRI